MNQWFMVGLGSIVDLVIKTRRIFGILREQVGMICILLLKPVGLSATAIVNSSEAGDIVLDTFGGSGSTLMAAEQLYRKCYMVELDPVYCQVIIDRWEAFTGEKAVKLN